MAKLLADDAVVVTGASNGIGRAIALEMAAHGASVVCADIESNCRTGERPTHEAVEEETDSQTRFVTCDVTDRSDLETAVEVAADEFGGLDCMVNNVGISIRHDLFDVTADEYDRIMGVNAKGTFFGSQVAAERMSQEGEGGCILNVSSISGMVGTQTSVPYSASKGAVRLMTYSMANQLGSAGIRVNAIHPSFMETELSHDILSDEEIAEKLDDIPLGRFGNPTDVGKTAVLLASDLAGFINAQSIVVDGGELNTL